MNASELRELRASCLINASNILGESGSTLTEAAGKADEPKEVKELNDAIKNKDPKAIKEKLNAFKVWFFKAEPDKKLKWLNYAIKIAYVSLSGITGYGLGYGAAYAIGKVIEGKKSYVLPLILAVVAYIGELSAINFINSVSAKFDKEHAEEYAKEFRKSAAKIKAELDNAKDKSTSEYKALLKLYDKTLACAEIYESIKFKNDKAQGVKDAKAALKDAKKSKDSVKIADAKIALAKAKSLTETVSILFEEASASDNIEDAQEIIEKAKDLQEKAIDMLDDTAEKVEKIECEDGECDKKEEKKECDKKDEAITEAIDLLLRAAVMCESADEANEYVQKAEELQKAVEDIPEEKPDEAKEYPEDTSGGEGLREDHLEDTKGLVDDDKEAIDIMTVDEDSLTID